MCADSVPCWLRRQVPGSPEPEDVILGTSWVQRDHSEKHCVLEDRVRTTLNVLPTFLCFFFLFLLLLMTRSGSTAGNIYEDGSNGKF